MFIIPSPNSITSFISSPLIPETVLSNTTKLLPGDISCDVWMQLLTAFLVNSPSKSEATFLEGCTRTLIKLIDQTLETTGAIGSLSELFANVSVQSEDQARWFIRTLLVGSDALLIELVSLDRLLLLFALSLSSNIHIAVEAGIVIPEEFVHQKDQQYSQEYLSTRSFILVQFLDWMQSQPFHSELREWLLNSSCLIGKNDHLDFLESFTPTQLLQQTSLAGFISEWGTDVLGTTQNASALLQILNPSLPTPNHIAELFVWIPSTTVQDDHQPSHVTLWDELIGTDEVSPQTLTQTDFTYEPLLHSILELYQDQHMDWLIVLMKIQTKPQWISFPVSRLYTLLTTLHDFTDFSFPMAKLDFKKWSSSSLLAFLRLVPYHAHLFSFESYPLTEALAKLVESETYERPDWMDASYFHHFLCLYMLDAKRALGLLQELTISGSQEELRIVFLLLMRAGAHDSALVEASIHTSAQVLEIGANPSQLLTKTILDQILMLPNGTRMLAASFARYLFLPKGNWYNRTPKLYDSIRHHPQIFLNILKHVEDPRAFAALALWGADTATYTEQDLQRHTDELLMSKCQSRKVQNCLSSLVLIAAEWYNECAALSSHDTSSALCETVASFPQTGVATLMKGVVDIWNRPPGCPFPILFDCARELIATATLPLHVLFSSPSSPRDGAHSYSEPSSSRAASPEQSLGDTSFNLIRSVRRGNLSPIDACQRITQFTPPDRVRLVHLIVEESLRESAASRMERLGSFTGFLIISERVDEVCREIIFNLILTKLKDRTSLSIHFTASALSIIRPRILQWPSFTKKLGKHSHLESIVPGMVALLNGSTIEPSPPSSPPPVHEIHNIPQPNHDGESRADQEKGNADKDKATEHVQLHALDIRSIDSSEQLLPEKLLGKLNVEVGNIDPSSMKRRISTVHKLLIGDTARNIRGFAEYMVVRRIALEPNFHELYERFLNGLKIPQLWDEIRASTYKACKQLLYHSSLVEHSNRELLRILGSWIGTTTLVRGIPILSSQLRTLDIIQQAIYRETLSGAVPFLVAMFYDIDSSDVFKPPNPWTMMHMAQLDELLKIGQLHIKLQLDIERLHSHLCITRVKLSHFLVSCTYACPPHLRMKAEQFVDAENVMTPKGESTTTLPTAAAPINQSSDIHSPTSSQTFHVYNTPLVQTTAAPISIQSPMGSLSRHNSPISFPCGQLQHNAKPFTPPSMSKTSVLPSPTHRQPPYNMTDPEILSAADRADFAALESKVQIGNESVVLGQSFQKDFRLSVCRAVEAVVIDLLNILDSCIEAACRCTRYMIAHDYALEQDEECIREAARAMSHGLSIGLSQVRLRTLLYATIQKFMAKVVKRFFVNHDDKDRNQVTESLTTMNSELISFELARRTGLETTRVVDEYLSPILEKLGSGERRSIIFDALSTASREFIDVLPEDLRPLSEAAPSDSVHLSYQNFRTIGVKPEVFTVERIMQILDVIEKASIEHYKQHPPTSADHILSLTNRRFTQGIWSPHHKSIREKLLELRLLISPTCTRPLLHTIIPQLSNLADKMQKVNLTSDDVKGTPPHFENPSLCLTMFMHEVCLFTLQIIRSKSVKTTIKLTTNVFLAHPQVWSQLELAVNLLRLRALDRDKLNQTLILALKCPERDEAKAFIKHLVQRNVAPVPEHLGGDPLEEAISMTIGLVETPAKDTSPFVHVPMPLVFTQSHVHFFQEWFKKTSSVVQPERKSRIQEEFVFKLQFDASKEGVKRIEKLVLSLTGFIVQQYATRRYFRRDSTSAVKSIQPSGMDGHSSNQQQTEPELLLVTGEAKTVPFAILSSAKSVQDSQSPNSLEGLQYAESFAELLGALLTFLPQMAGKEPKVQESRLYIFTRMVACIFKSLQFAYDAHHQTGTSSSSSSSWCTTPLPPGAIVHQSEFQQQPFACILRKLMDLVFNIEDSLLDKMVSQFGESFHSCCPLKLPGFTFAWLELISHATFMNVTLDKTHRWPLYYKLLVDALRSLKAFHRAEPDVSRTLALFYKCLFKLMVSIMHDYPNMMVAYHHPLCAECPSRFMQLRSVILSAYPSNTKLPNLFSESFDYTTLSNMMEPPLLVKSVFSCFDKFSKLSRNDIKSFLRIGEPKDISIRVKSAICPKTHESINQGHLQTIVLCVGLSVHEVLRSERRHGRQQQPARNNTNGTQQEQTYQRGFDFLLQSMEELGTEGAFWILNASANQLRYPNSITFFFLNFFLHLFDPTTSDQSNAISNTLWMIYQELSLRVLAERASTMRPFPWGLVLMLRRLYELKRQISSKPFFKSNPNAFEAFKEIISHTYAHAQQQQRRPLQQTS